MAQLTPPQPVLHRLRVQLAAIAVVMVATIAGGSVAAYHVYGSVDALISTATRARLRAAAADAVLSALRDAETGQRGYLLTGRLTYLAPYYDSIGHIDALLDQLAAYTRGIARFQADYDALAAAARDKTAELRGTVTLAQRDGVPAALSVMNTDRGRALMDEARRSVAAIAAQSLTERDRQLAKLTRQQHFVVGFVLLGLGGSILLLGTAAILLLVNRARLIAARTGHRREEERAQAAVEHVRDGVAVFDRDGLLTLVNTRFARALGVPEQLVVPGVAFTAIADAVTLDPALLHEPLPAEALVTEVREGKRTLEIWRSPMPGGGNMLSVADVSRRVAAEDAARQSQKMDVLGQMTGGVAHDFNNLLQVVSANLELLRSRIGRAVPDPQPLLARLDAAAAGAARGARLTRHLLAFARRQPLAPEALDAARLLQGTEEVLRRTLGESIDFALAIAPDLWFMRADPTQFENALLNLALNARDAMSPAGTPQGRFTIEAANATLDAAFAARDKDIAPGQYVVFALTDTGSGMTPEQLVRAVEPFYTTKAEGRGTGLGLSMVLGFAKQSGGHLDLASEPGHGTTARLYIPRSAAPDARNDPQADAGSLPEGEGALVLLVEDDPGVRQVARDALLGLGYQVVEAETADAALALLNGGCRPRLVFTDVVMPGQVTARAMTRQAQAMIPGLAVLFTSGYTQNSIVHDGQLDADVALLSKPWRREDLARALYAAIQGTALRPPPRRRVLLVEDEELTRMTTADALTSLGFDVIEAATATAALARLAPPPDLLLADLGLPDGDGVLLATKARARVPGLPVIVTSGQPGRAADGIVWLRKPFDTEALRQALSAALGAP